MELTKAIAHFLQTGEGSEAQLARHAQQLRQQQAERAPQQHHASQPTQAEVQAAWARIAARSNFSRGFGPVSSAPAQSSAPTRIEDGKPDVEAIWDRLARESNARRGF